jgi:hypothetical protein
LNEITTASNGLCCNIRGRPDIRSGAATDTRKRWNGYKSTRRICCPTGFKRAAREAAEQGGAPHMRARIVAAQDVVVRQYRSARGAAVVR